MEAKVLHEAGYQYAIEGIGLSYNIYDFERLEGVARKLAPQDGGHNKFLESMQVWINIRGARYWWQEFDTYRVGTTKQSESTIHTITHRLMTLEDFEGAIYDTTLRELNGDIRIYQAAKNKDQKKRIFKSIKTNLPEGFLQRRIVNTNYKTLKNVYWQRKYHKLDDWKIFIAQVVEQLEYPEFIVGAEEKEHENKGD